MANRAKAESLKQYLQALALSILSFQMQRICIGLSIGVNPGRLGVANPQILGRGVLGSQGVVGSWTGY